jgi:hypothetical protein
MKILNFPDGKSTAITTSLFPITFLRAIAYTYGQLVDRIHCQTEERRLGAQHGVTTRGPRSPSGGLGRHGGGVGGEKGLYFSFYVAAVVKPSGIFFLPCIFWVLGCIAPSGLVASFGVQTWRLQRPSTRAG